MLPKELGGLERDALSELDSGDSLRERIEAIEDTDNLRKFREFVPFVRDPYLQNIGGCGVGLTQAFYRTRFNPYRIAYFPLHDLIAEFHHKWVAEYESECKEIADRTDVRREYREYLERVGGVMALAEGLYGLRDSLNDQEMERLRLEARYREWEDRVQRDFKGHGKLLFVRSVSPRSEEPCMDGVYRAMEKFLENSFRGQVYAGSYLHMCGGEAMYSTDYDLGIFMGEKLVITNSVALHYLAYHREELFQEEVDAILEAGKGARGG